MDIYYNDCTDQPEMIRSFEYATPGAGLKFRDETKKFVTPLVVLSNQESKSAKLMVWIIESDL